MVKDPSIVDKQVLGALIVVQQLGNGPPPDAYAMILDSGGKTIRFVGAVTTIDFPAIIRKLPLPMPRSVAAITSLQLGLAWETLQLCAWVPSHLPDDLCNQLIQAAGQLGVNAESLAIKRAIPDIEGRNVHTPFRAYRDYA